MPFRSFWATLYMIIDFNIFYLCAKYCGERAKYGQLRRHHLPRSTRPAQQDIPVTLVEFPEECRLVPEMRM